jgi:hypothetical protein
LSNQRWSSCIGNASELRSLLLDHLSPILAIFRRIQFPAFARFLSVETAHPGPDFEKGQNRPTPHRQRIDTHKSAYRHLALPSEPPPARNQHFLRLPGKHSTCKPTLFRPRQKRSTCRQTFARLRKKQSTCRCTFCPKCKVKPNVFVKSTTCRWSFCHNRRSTGGVSPQNESFGFRAASGAANSPAAAPTHILPNAKRPPRRAAVLRGDP